MHIPMSDAHLSINLVSKTLCPSIEPSDDFSALCHQVMRLAYSLHVDGNLCFSAEI